MSFRIPHFNFWVLIPVSIIIGFVIIINTYGYIFVLTNPQHAYLKNTSLASSQLMIINEKEYGVAGQWEVGIDDPQMYLGGVGGLSIINIFDGDDTSGLQIGILFDLNKIQNLQTTGEEREIPLSDIVNGLFVHIRDEKSAIKYLGNRICKSEFYSIDFTPNNTDIEGNLAILSLEQSLKRLIISGKFDVEKTQLHSYTKNICRDPSEKPNMKLSLEVRNATFSIDSPVIYEWSNKAGDTWRL